MDGIVDGVVQSVTASEPSALLLALAGQLVQAAAEIWLLKVPAAQMVIPLLALPV